MRAEVILFDPARDYYWAVTERYTVLFNLSSPAVVRIGDVLEGQAELYGERVLLNVTRDGELAVFIRELHRLGRPFKLVD
jgi:hypothetical protein